MCYFFTNCTEQNTKENLSLRRYYLFIKTWKSILKWNDSTMFLKQLSSNNNSLAPKTTAKRCARSVQVRSFSGPYFLICRLNTEIYFENIRIQSKYGKMQTRKSPYLDTFHAVKVFCSAYWLSFLTPLS